MKEFDTIGLMFAKQQASLFEASTSLDCSSSMFIKKYVFSSWARMFDEYEMVNYIFSTPMVLEEFKAQIDNKSIGKEKYPREVLYWIGYIYRFWAYTYELSTKQVYKIVKPEELKKVYIAYHSLDPRLAIQRILESKGMKIEDNNTKAKEILKGIK